MEANFEILIVHKPSLMSDPATNLGLIGSAARLDVYWIQTNKQTSKVYIHIYIDNRCNVSFTVNPANQNI